MEREDDGVPLTDVDRGGAAAFMMSNLSVRREGEGELVRSLGADEIKRDDLAIHASPDSTAASHSVRVHFFRPNGSNDIQLSSVQIF